MILAMPEYIHPSNTLSNDSHFASLIPLLQMILGMPD